METVGLFILLAGFVIGLGAVTVIDLHGFLGRKSEYWTLATTRTHKVTKPLIWAGMILALIGGFMFYFKYGINNITLYHLVSSVVMLLDGVFLSFSVSPLLLEREKEGRASELLTKSWQTKITISFIVSFLSWWSNLALVAWFLTHRI